ncbi:hypothetical protein GCM10009727_79900 [Actinomadura napierensis]|uniref:Uncharacterized protein n=1 Tax=Actinomadura napierensis TaxID=267854 RepID=A0ABN3AEP3_9ACTN
MCAPAVRARPRVPSLIEIGTAHAVTNSAHTETPANRRICPPYVPVCGKQCGNAKAPRPGVRLPAHARPRDRRGRGRARGPGALSRLSAGRHSSPWPPPDCMDS